MFYSQPQNGPFRLDLGNPLTRDLVLLHNLGPSRIHNAATGLAGIATGTKAVLTDKGLAAGFGATWGVSGSDRVQTDLAHHRPGPRTYYVIAKRTGTGGNGLGRFFGASGAVDFYQNAANLTFSSVTTGTSPVFTYATGTTAVWKSIAITHDSTSASNRPRIYVDGGAGALMSVLTAGTGSPVTVSSPVYIGNNNTGIRGFDGQILLLAVWDRILSADEINALDRNPWQIFADLDDEEDVLQARASATFNATAVSTARATAQLSTSIRLSASPKAQAGSTAQLSTSIRLSTSPKAQAGSTAQLSTSIRLGASPKAQVTAAAGLQAGATALMAAPKAACGVTANLITTIHMAAVGTATGTASATLSGSSIALAAGARSHTGVSASLVTSIRLAAQARNQASTSADLATSIHLGTSAYSGVQAPAELTTQIRLTATARMQSSLLAGLPADTHLAVAATMQCSVIALFAPSGPTMPTLGAAGRLGLRGTPRVGIGPGSAPTRPRVGIGARH